MGFFSSSFFSLFSDFYFFLSLLRVRLQVHKSLLEMTIFIFINPACFFKRKLLISPQMCDLFAGSTLQLPGCPTIITRAQWGARQPTEYIGNMARTPSFIFIHHGASAFCSSRTSCQSIIRGWQNQHIGQSMSLNFVNDLLV